MSCSLPQEILDLIVDHLHDEPAALKACCIVTKSWIPRSRKHLFARVEFDTQKSHVELWKKAFPDPSNSPAYHTRSLSISGCSAITAASTDVGGWIRTFRNVIHLRFDFLGQEAHQASLIPFHGLSPTVRSLCLTSTTAEDFNLVCSFPLLEDLSFVCFGSDSEPDRWNAPLRSPKLTGSLDLRTIGGFRAAICRLLDFPDGLHFTKIKVSCLARDFESTTELVSRCSGTLESFTICNWFPGPGTLLDLSKATELKHLMFWWRGSNTRWIVAALQTIESKKLEQITIYPINLKTVIDDAVHREWEDLDRQLVQFSTSHSIRTRVMYEVVDGRVDTKNRVLSLLPELVRRELVDLVLYSPLS